MTKKWKNISYSALSLLLFLLVLEGAFRIYLIFSPTSETREHDERLGWRVIPDLERTFELDYAGTVQYNVNEYGFRKWGDVNAKKPKVLFIGDSYTHAEQVTQGKVYYNIIDSLLDSVEIFAFGCGGYGTLQEIMVVDSFYHIIQPDLIVWQFCHNDFVNNNRELECQSKINNYLMRKPYLVGDTILYQFPGSLPMQMLSENSKLVRLFSLKWFNMLHRYYGTVEQYPEEIRAGRKPTEDAFTLISQKYPRSVVFSANTSYGYVNLSEILENAGIPFITEVHEELARGSVEAGLKYDYAPQDWHWNEAGHRLVGTILARELKAHLPLSEEPANPVSHHIAHLPSGEIEVQ